MRFQTIGRGAVLELGGTPLHEARAALARAIERTAPARRRVALTSREGAAERARMRDKVRGTMELRARIVEAVDAMRAPVLRGLGIREADEGPSLARLLSLVDRMQGTDLEAALTATLTEIYRVGTVHARVEIGAEFNVSPDRAIKIIKEHALSLSRSVADGERSALRKLITEAFASGLHPRGIATLIEEFFADGVHRPTDSGGRTIPLDTWAETVARTEVARAQNAGLVDAYTEAGVSSIKWVSADDERVEPLCEALDGEVVKLGDPFPGTDVDQPPLHPNCRCGIVAVDFAVGEAFFGHAGRPGKRGGSAPRDAVGINVTKVPALRGNALKEARRRFLSEWRDESTGPESAVIQATLNVLSGRDPTTDFGPQLIENYQERDWGEQTGKMNRPLIGLAKAMAGGQAEAPGVPLFRGVSAGEAEVLMAAKEGDSIGFRPLISTTSRQEVAMSFGRSSRFEDSPVSAMLLRFDGLRGEHVFAGPSTDESLKFEAETILRTDVSEWRVSRVENNPTVSVQDFGTDEPRNVRIIHLEPKP